MASETGHTGDRSGRPADAAPTGSAAGDGPGRSRSAGRSLGVVQATMLGIGAMIGAGIFVLTGLAADEAGPAAILAFALNGVVTTFTALSYAELASAVPRSGGGYAFVREAFPDLVAFLMGWMLWFAYMIAGSLYALGFAPNLVELVRFYWEGMPSPPVPYALGAVAVLVTLNVVSTRASGGAETLVTVLKLGVLALFVAFGFDAVKAGNFRPFFPQGAEAVLPAMGLTFIAFEGYDLITTVTEEVREPRKNIPRAIFISLGVTVLVYVLVVVVAVGTVGAGGLAEAGETAIARAAEDFMPSLPALGSGAAIIAFGAVFSTVSALNAVVLASSRVAFAMGREEQLPRRLGQLHSTFGTPIAAILASAVVMAAAVAAVPVERVGELSSLFFLLSFVLVNLAAIHLRRTRPDLRRPFSMPLYPLPPVLGIVGNLALGFFIDLRVWAMGLGWLALGAVAHLLWRRLGSEDEEESAK